MTERHNIELIQQGYALFAAGDMPGFLELLADDVEWILPGPPGVLPFAGVRRGREQVAQFFAVLNDALEYERFEPREFLASGDKVVVLGFSRDRLKANGRIVETDWVAVFTIRDGKVARYQVFEDTAAFVAALQ